MLLQDISPLFSNYVDLDDSNVEYDEVDNIPKDNGYIVHRHILFKELKGCQE